MTLTPGSRITWIPSDQDPQDDDDSWRQDFDEDPPDASPMTGIVVAPTADTFWTGADADGQFFARPTAVPPRPDMVPVRWDQGAPSALWAFTRNLAVTANDPSAGTPATRR